METENITGSTCIYLLHLKDFSGKPLIHHKRKTFVIGFISTIKSMILIEKELLNRNKIQKNCVLTYKFF